MLFLRLVSTDSFTSTVINIDNDQSDNLDATFYITSNRVCRWLSTINHADHLSVHTLLFLSIGIYISVHLFLSTLLLLFESFIVCRYVHVECTDERKSKVHRYSQRLREMSERNTQTHIARLPALKTPYSQALSNSPWFVWYVSYKRETVRLVGPLGDIHTI